MELNCFVPDSFRLKPTKSGSLSGITFVVKDNIAISGHTSSFGNSKWRDTHEKSKQNAPVIRKILDNGGEIVGLTKLDEMTYSLVGNISEGTPPINSLYPDRFAGGSSSGTASAIAGDVAQVGIGTDTGGSIRIPAGACGLYSIRPSYNMIETDGVLPLAQPFDTVGITSKDPELIKKTFLVVKSNKELVNPKIKRILLPIDTLNTASDDTALAIKNTSMRIADILGAEIIEDEFDSFLNQQLADLFSRIQGRAIWKDYSEWVNQNSNSLFPEVQKRLKMAEVFFNATSKELEQDQKSREIYSQELAKHIGNDTVVVLPVMRELPPKRNASDEELLEFRKAALRFTSPSGLSGFPEVVMPIKSGKTGLTYGLGILGFKNSDMSLLDVLIAYSKEFESKSK